MLTYIYADDIVIVNLFSCSNTFSLTRINDLEIITRWFISNGLHLNLSKFSSLMVGFSSCLTRLHSFNIINSNPINILSYIKILGIHFDPSWSLKHHVSIVLNIGQHMSYFVRCIYFVTFFLSHRNSLSRNCLLFIYLFLLFFDYADIVYILNPSAVCVIGSSTFKIRVYILYTVPRNSSDHNLTPLSSLRIAQHLSALYSPLCYLRLTFFIMVFHHIFEKYSA